MTADKDQLAQANSVINLFKNGASIVIGIGTAVVSCAYAYWNIFDNTKDIAAEKKERIEAIQTLEKKSELRYDHAMEICNKLESKGLEEMERLREIQIKLERLEAKYEVEHSQCKHYNHEKQ